MTQGLKPRDAMLYDQGLKRCYRCDSVKPLDDFESTYRDRKSCSGRRPECRLCHKKESRELYLRFKYEAFQKYSVTTPPSCVCCGESVVQFLSLDHINGGGNKHRKEVGTGIGFYRWLKRNNFPEGFQTMCHNCNQAKWAYGACPHDGHA
jgi:hypothetical protein